jgi:hypothetical protein
LRGTVSANNFNNGGGDFWYYILPGGDLYEFTANYGTPALTGTLVAHLGVAYYDDPTLLTAASSSPPPVTLGVAGNELTITPGSGYAGTFVVVATAGDGQASTSISFKVAVTPANPPTLAPIADQTVAAGGSVTVALQGSDPSGLPLTYSATAETLAYQLKSSYGLYLDPGGLYTNYRGQGEVYLRGTTSANNFNNGGGDFWYYILPGGDLYEFTAPYVTPALTGTFVAHLGVAYYDDPTLLTNATNVAQTTSLSVAGNQLTIAPADGSAGSFLVDVTASDGLLSDTKTFRVTVS